MRAEDSPVTSVYIIELKAVRFNGEAAVGFGLDLVGHEFAVELDQGLAHDIAMALSRHEHPIVAVERPPDGRESVTLIDLE
jgi:hypothetical protein